MVLTVQCSYFTPLWKCIGCGWRRISASPNVICSSAAGRGAALTAEPKAYPAASNVAEVSAGSGTWVCFEGEPLE